ncbi:hypothetical protein M0R72_01370 [Candidatus Pacearchaeota archaeon]|jgi:hypothetical protein|nr:hypothetical protein [Candidatus Pacearchaeota archaeon]
MGGGIPKTLAAHMRAGENPNWPKRFVFASTSRHIETASTSVWNEGELWRVVGVPGEVPTGKHWKVTLEEIPSDTLFTATEEEMDKAISNSKQKIIDEELAKD